jgi:predicted acylesterase/phospholipase RssA
MKFNAGHVYQITVPKFRQNKRTVPRFVSQRAEGKMTASGPVPWSDLPFQAPARGGQWPREPTYDRGGLNADLVREGSSVKGIGLAGAISVLAEAGYRFPHAAGTSAAGIVTVHVAADEKCGKDMTRRRYLTEVTRMPGAGRA